MAFELDPLSAGQVATNDNAFDGAASVAEAPGKRTRTQGMGPSIDRIADRVATVLQRRAENDGAPGAAAEVAVAQASGSSGAPLPGAVRERFEGSLGADLSAVRVHTGADSATAAQAVGAHAYATGNDIHFAAGKYQPDDPFGVHLLAHEVAHTVQQSGGTAPSRQYKLEVSSPGDAAEHDADRAADAMVAGRSATVGSMSGGAQTLHRDPDDQQRIKAAKGAFDLAVNQASLKFGLIAQQQGFIVQQTKEAAIKEEPPTTEIAVISAIAGAAIGAVAGPLGAAVASRVAAVAVQQLATDLATKAIEGAFIKGGAAAGEAASKAIARAGTDATTAEVYFNCIQLTYASLAGRHSDAFLQQMRAMWQSAESSPVTAEDAQKHAEAARDGLQVGLDEQAFATDTQNAAFSGLCSILSHGGAGGVLKLQLTVGKNGNLGGGIFEDAGVAGITSALAGLVTGRPLSSYKMPIQINASYFTERPKVGADDSDGHGGQPIDVSFTVNVSEKGTATAQTPDAWLLARGGGDANAGAQSMYQAMSGWSVPLKKL